MFSNGFIYIYIYIYKYFFKLNIWQNFEYIFKNFKITYNICEYQIQV